MQLTTAIVIFRGGEAIPSDVFAARSEMLPKEKKIIVYCNTGGRSYTATAS